MQARLSSSSVKSGFSGARCASKLTRWLLGGCSASRSEELSSSQVVGLRLPSVSCFVDFSTLLRVLLRNRNNRIYIYIYLSHTYIRIKSMLYVYRYRCIYIAVSYTHLTLPTKQVQCRSRWSPYH